MAQQMNSNNAALCPRCKGDGAVLTQLPTQTESTNYGWAGYVPFRAVAAVARFSLPPRLPWRIGTSKSPYHTTFLSLRSI